MAAFKDSLKLPTAELRKIERDQEINPDHHFDFLYRGTGSQLRILKKSLTTPPHIWCCALLIPSHSTTHTTTEWRKTHEVCALEEYRKHHHSRGNPDMVMSNAGFATSEDYPFLGSSPDGYVCGPNALESYGLVKVKCPSIVDMHQLMLALMLISSVNLQPSLAVTRKF